MFFSPSQDIRTVDWGDGWTGCAGGKCWDNSCFRRLLMRFNSNLCFVISNSSATFGSYVNSSSSVGVIRERAITS